MTPEAQRYYPNSAQSFGITGIIIVGMLIMIPVYTFLTNVVGREASMLIYYILSIGISCWIILSYRKSISHNHPFNLSIVNPKVIVFIFPVTIALLFGVIQPIGELIPVPENMENLFEDLVKQKGVFTFLLMVVAAPVLEEILFRGIMLDGLLKQYSPLKAILLSSFLFGFVHLNPWQFVTGFILGIFSGWIYY